MKKIFSLGIVLTATLALSACGTQSGSKQTTTEPANNQSSDSNKHKIKKTNPQNKQNVQKSSTGTASTNTSSTATISSEQKQSNTSSQQVINSSASQTEDQTSKQNIAQSATSNSQSVSQSNNLSANQIRQMLVTQMHANSNVLATIPDDTITSIYNQAVKKGADIGGVYYPLLKQYPSIGGSDANYYNQQSQSNQSSSQANN
ncbi:hypothetical protein AYR56_09800 [Loigolactobacillus backii]|uniref:Lipoprotein n=1 Tax=Loigolactobacillus backii TaxID=375175 RepID=A0A192H2I4_9LACO|nr:MULTISPECIES: hypothetical protein [Loigolactobacillus]ANK62575.1 hypothetical protein AYR53_07205 [Loigolactobacillus backii]ANK70415.1 hypothetical protein AYR56_09800 [Loigolactobacillus backii]